MENPAAQRAWDKFMVIYMCVFQECPLAIFFGINAFNMRN